MATIIIVRVEGVDSNGNPIGEIEVVEGVTILDDNND